MKFLLAALVGTTFTSLTTATESSSIHSSFRSSLSLQNSENKDTDNFWWRFNNSDCGYDDVSPQPDCGKKNVGNVASLQECCLQTSGCGGFNTNGIIKKTDCLTHVDNGEPCDLYVLEHKPQPVLSDFPTIWPYPAQFTNGTTTINVAGTLKYSLTSGSSDTLSQAFTRYHGITFPHVSSTADAKQILKNIIEKDTAEMVRASPLASLTVTVEDLDASAPQLETDESYNLTIPADGTPATLTAKTIYGAMHGLETFSQLVHFDFDTETYIIENTPWSIQDVPRFPHRGLMMDTARHFETLQSIRDMIDSLVYAKMNVLHWHMSDSQSFPMQSKTYPKLWNGAWSLQERYTQADIASIVEYARLRGVGVMVEFDMPGHAAAWCTGYPEICPSSTCTQPLNVANNATFDLITSLLGEMTGPQKSTKGAPQGLFPKNMIHLGGDEVNTDCWTKTPSVAKWLQDHNMTADDGYAYFVKQTAAIASANGRRPVQWSEVFDHFKTELPKDVIVHIWKSVTNVTEVVADGYNVLLNVGYDKTSWYLDNLNVGWKAVYTQDPCGGTNSDLCKLILGGHGEMWGETVDASDFEQTVWPRLGAIAERLWSPAEQTTSPDMAELRMEEFRCLLNRRGVKAAPPKNQNARSSPPGPGSCLQQRR
jgi:hexosaminidase